MKIEEKVRGRQWDEKKIFMLSMSQAGKFTCKSADINKHTFSLSKQNKICLNDAKYYIFSHSWTHEDKFIERELKSAPSVEWDPLE